MRKFSSKVVLVCGILVSCISVGYSAMSENEREKARHNCYFNDDKNACQALNDNGLDSVEQCDKNTCGIVGAVYRYAGHY